MSNQEIYDAGFNAAIEGDDQISCPFLYPDSEQWHNGYIDGEAES